MLEIPGNGTCLGKLQAMTGTKPKREDTGAKNSKAQIKVGFPSLSALTSQYHVLLKLDIYLCFLMVSLLAFGLV
jgi:hypothetical protein